jgi:YD repeat-containing protein
MANGSLVGRALRAMLLAPAVVLASVTAAQADIVYLYDDLGRLARIIRDDGEAATYQYDAVGNILQIIRESGVSQTTTVTSTSASSGAAGLTVPLTITGTNLMGASVVCTTPGLIAQNVRTDFGQITLELVIDQSAASGPAQCEVRGVTTTPLAFSVIRTVPAFLGSLGVSVQVAQPLVPFVATGVSIRVADPPLFVDRSVLGAVSVQVAPPESEIATGAVSVSFQPVITSVSPAIGAPATPSLAVRVLGAGLDGATTVSFRRNNAADPDITVVTFSVSPDGTEANLEIAIAASAPVGARVIRITTPAGSSTPGGTGGNLFTVQ